MFLHAWAFILVLKLWYFLVGNLHLCYASGIAACSSCMLVIESRLHVRQAKRHPPPYISCLQSA